MSTAVLVFTKAPQPGASKTRLIPALGADEAAAAHEVLVLRTLDMTRDLGVAGEDYQVSLWGAVPHPALDLWSDQFALPLHLQAAGDLGQKMLHGFASALDAGADQAVLIGSDCPAMTAEYIRQACAALRASDRSPLNRQRWLVGIFICRPQSSSTTTGASPNRFPSKAFKPALVPR